MPDIFVAPKKETKKPKPKENKIKKTHRPLAAFYKYPIKIDFETRDKEEEVILLLRRHPITNLPWILITLALLFAPRVLEFFPLLAFLPENFQFVAVVGWYLITAAFVLENFLSWFFNVYIVTDERIIDIDFHNLIYKEVSDAKIDKIQDITYKMGGVARTIFNYGDVLIQTAAEVPTFDFEAVPHPDEVVKILQKLMLEEEQEKIEGRVR